MAARSAHQREACAPSEPVGRTPHRLEPGAEDVLEIVQGDGESTAVRSSNLYRYERSVLLFAYATREIKLGVSAAAPVCRATRPC